MTDGGLDPVSVGAAAAKHLFSVEDGEIKTCTTRLMWGGLRWISDLWGVHPLMDGRIEKTLIRRGVFRMLRDWKTPDTKA